ncbi:MAG: hypothetical protein ACI9R3_001502 [Verrucomicrobiales bacterium]
MSAFRREGGHVTRVWGVLRNRYFQNALQLGSFYFDVANDTVDVTKPKVEYMAMAESGFRNIESYSEFADVAERYWECEIYPNLHFPRLAPLLPLVKISRAGVLSLACSIYLMQRMNLDSGFVASEEFISSSKWADRRLSDEWLERIQRYKAEHFSEQIQTPRGGVESAEVAQLCAEYRTSNVYSSRSSLARVLASAKNLTIKAP